MRVKQKPGDRGSLKFMQRIVSQRPDVLNERLAARGIVTTGADIRWVSPREDDDWAEYRDGAFLEKLGRSDLAPALSAFWPAQGPQWDALGIAGNTLLLVEAKAHIGELASNCAATSTRSLEMIKSALDSTKRALGVTVDTDWLTGYYQLANRIAHLEFLRRHGADAQLVMLQFTGETGMPTPSTRAAFDAAFARAMEQLNISGNVPGMTRVYVDVADIA